MSLRVVQLFEQGPRRVEAELDAEPHTFVEIRASVVLCHEDARLPLELGSDPPVTVAFQGASTQAAAPGQGVQLAPECGKVEESVEYFYLAVFKGTYRHRIDPKGRLPVPAAFRRQLQAQGASGVVATPLDQCVAVYPPCRVDPPRGSAPGHARLQPTGEGAHAASRQPGAGPRPRRSGAHPPSPDICARPRPWRGKCSSSAFSTASRSGIPTCGPASFASRKACSTTWPQTSSGHSRRPRRPPALRAPPASIQSARIHRRNPSAS